MRIRKHAKISPLLYTASSLKPGAIFQPHVCQLNQSPWDAMSFSPPSPPPPPSQANVTDISAGNGSSDRRRSVAEREVNTWSQSEHPTAMEEERPPAPPQKQEITFCCKTDGKSWQCRREASKGNSLCEHHLSLLKSYSSAGHHPTKKSNNKPAGEALPRRKKAPASSSAANPYEFYYYSGFGPRWGKKRGETGQNSRAAKNVHENGIEATMRQEESFNYVEYEDDDDDDDDDGNDEGNRDNGRKRMRKPIKARSLKSLM